MTTSRRAANAAALALPLWLAACAAPHRAPSSNAQPSYWAGRLALQVDETPPHAFSAMFELRGDPQKGELLLTTPLGTRLAQLTWTERQASLQTSTERRTAASLPALVQELTGAALPVAALFDWLQGQPTEADGWHVDLGRMPEGRLEARRNAPSPAATLRILLDR